MNKLVIEAAKKVITSALQKISPEETDDRLCCPNCGRSEWSIRNYSDIQCNACYSKYINLGKYGLVKQNNQ